MKLGFRHMKWNINYKFSKIATFSNKQEPILKFSTITDGMSYEDKVAFYEKEFDLINKTHIEKIKKTIDSELTKESKELCDSIFEELVSITSPIEHKALLIFCKEFNKKMKGYDITKTKLSFPEYSKRSVLFWPKNNPNWGQIELGSNSSASGNNSKTEKTELKNEKVEKEPEKKKQIVDVKILSYDTAKKINLIKEIKTLMNLGLKESKELVESIPNVIKVGVKVEEAETLKEKLKDLCVIELI